MRSRTGAGLCCAVLLLAGARPADAQLWRNGDFDGFSGLASAHTGDFEGRLYDNFVVSGTGWHITSLYAEFLTDFVPEAAYWEIRSGITPGFGGTLLYSLTSPVTDFTDLGEAFGLEHLALTVGGFGSFNLAPGEYWLTIALIGEQGSAFVGTTDGLNGINPVTDLKFFFDSPSNGFIFANEGPDFNFLSDFSYGLDGREISVVPEPSTLILVGTGVGMVALFGRRRQRRNG